eukprot:scaffold2657_cov89-Amphora_coffeaeformis.AAC.38
MRFMTLKGFQRPLWLTAVSLFLVLAIVQPRSIILVSAFQPISQQQQLLSRDHGIFPIQSSSKCRSVDSWCLPASTKDPSNDNNVFQPSRRQWLSSVAAVTSSTLLLPTMPSHAALLQFPCAKLKNRYHFMRAGTSELEAEGIYASNALFLTNRENALTDQAQDSVVQACRIMREAGELPTVAYHSLAANGMDTADLVARTLLLARDRLLPEFTYLDPRGIGLWDNSQYQTTRLAIAAMDNAEAGPDGLGGRPPANDDGTPNETLGDQFIRLRQFFSLQESRTSGESILVIFPDGTGPALASAMIAGIPLNQCHALEYAPGEIRLDITKQSVSKLFAEKEKDPAYTAMLDEGKEYLAALRTQTSSGSSSFVSLKDQRAEERRLEADRVFAVEQKRKQREAENERQQALAKLRQAEVEAKQEKLRLRQKQQQEREQNGSDGSAVAGMSLGDANINPMTAVAAVGAAVAGAALANGGNNNNVATNTDASSSNDEASIPMMDPEPSPGQLESVSLNGDSNDSTMSAAETSASSTPPVSSLYSQPVPVTTTGNMERNNGGMPNPSADVVAQELESLQAAQDRFRTSVLEPNMPTASSANNNTSNGNASSVDQELETLEKGKATLDNYFDFADDGSDDWLRVLAEIRDEEEG